MTEIERRLKQAEENEKARQSTGKGTTSTQTGRSAASSSSGRSDTERRLRIAEEENRKYSAPAANRRAALQRKTEAFMEEITEAEPEARAAIDRYKAAEDAKYYAAMNQRGAAIGDDAMLERGRSGYERSSDQWRASYDKGPQASQPVAAETPERAARNRNYWAEAAKQAAQFGDQARYGKAMENVAEADRDARNASALRQKEYERQLEALQQSNPAEYYALTKSDDEIDKLIAYYDYGNRNEAGRAAYVNRTPEEEAEYLNNLRRARFDGESDAARAAYIRAEQERYEAATKSYENRRTVMDNVAGRTMRNVTNDPDWIAYFDRTPEEEAEYLNNLRRARFAGESDAEREAYIQGEQDRYAEQFRNYQNGPEYSDSMEGARIEAGIRIEALERAKAIHELERVDKSPANIEAGRAALREQQGHLLTENKYYYDKKTMSHLATGAGPADSRDYQEMIDKGWILYSDFYELPAEQQNNVYAAAAKDPEKAVSLAQHYLKLADDEHYQKIYDWVNKDSGWQFGRRALGMVGGAALKLASGLDPYGSTGQSASKTGNALISGGAASAARNGLFGIEALGGDESGISSDVPFIGRGQAGITYQVGASVLQSAAIAAPAMLLGNYSEAAAKVAEVLGTTLMGSSAAADDYTQCIQNGMTVHQARMHATAAGIAEAAFEYISLDKLVDPNLTTSALKRWLQQAGIEASEEVVTSIANRISDELLADHYGIESAVERRTRELMEEGLAYNAARGKAENEWLAEITQDGMSGFLSGLIMGGGSEIMRGVKTFRLNRANRNTQTPTTILQQEAATDSAELSGGTEQATVGVGSVQQNADKAQNQQSTEMEQGRSDAQYMEPDELDSAIEYWSGLLESARGENNQEIVNRYAGYVAGLKQVQQERADLNQRRLEAGDDLGLAEGLGRVGVEQVNPGQAATGSQADYGGQRMPATAEQNGGMNHERIQGGSQIGGDSGQIARAADDGQLAARAAGPADSGQRDAGLGSDRQAGGLGEGTGRSVAGGAAAQELYQLRNQVRALEAERRSAAQIGIAYGTKNESLRVVPEELYTSAMRSEQARAEENGVRLTFVTGGAIEIRGKGGSILKADGLHQVDADGTSHIFARADSKRFAPEQLTRHEDFHDMVANNRGLLLDMVEALYETQGEEGVARLVDAYVTALDGCYGVYTEGMTEDDQRALAMLYLEEIFADQYAGMNRSSGEARRAAELAGGVAQRFAGDIENARQNRAGIDRRNGPGTRLSAEEDGNYIIIPNKTEDETSPLHSRPTEAGGDESSSINSIRDNNPDVKTEDRGIDWNGNREEPEARLSAADADDDSLGVDWIGSREEGETKTQAVTETDAPHPSPAATPSPEGEGSETGGQAARVTENAQALAREKKVSIAEKASIEGLKSRIESEEKRLGAYQILQQEGMMTDEIRAQMRDVQESLEIFRNALDEKKAKRKAAKEAEKNNKELRAQRKQARAAEKKALAKEAELQADKPRQARKEFRQDALNLFSVPAAKRQTLGNLLNRFADTVTEKGSVSEADRRDLFRQLYEAGVEVAQPEDYYRDIRDFVKSGRVYVPEDVRAEFGDDWDAFRKRAWGNGIYLTNDQNDRGADVWNAELAEVFPGSFDASETDARNMLENIVDLAEEGKAEFVSIEEMMRRNQDQYGVTVDQQMDELEQKVDHLIDTFAQKAELEQKVKKAGVMQLVKERQKNRELAAQQTQRKRENETRSQVMKQLQTLNKMRKKSAPEIQKQIDSIIGNLDTMARSISPAGLEDLQALSRKYMEAAEDPNFLGNPYVEARLARLNQVQLDDLEISDVIELGRTISALVKTVTDDRKLLTDARNKEVSEAASMAAKEIQGSEGSKGGKLRDFLGNEHLSPTREIQRLGGWVRGGQMEQRSRSLEDGGTRRMEYQRQATRIFDKFLADKANQKWLQTAQGKDAQWIKLTVPAGITGKDGALKIENVSFEITPMMRVGLLMHSRNDDNLRHIETGGIVIPNKEYYRKGDLANADAKGTRVKLRPETVRAIVRECTAQERAFAGLLEQYYDGLSKEKINEVSMQIDGFERAGGDHYYGIKVSRKFLAAQPEQIQRNLALDSIGSIVNERVHAGNPIILEDASKALEDHIDLISKYYGYTAAIRDFNAVMNYTFHESAKDGGTANAYAGSVKEILQDKWGSGAQKYLDKLLGDLQQSSGINETAAQFLAKLRGNLAGASLMFNPAVAVSQTASLPGAMQTLGLDGIVAALKPEKVDMGLIEKYSPVLQYRNQGNSTQELGDYMKEQGLEGKLPFFFNWIQKMDSWTIRRLWVGAEYRVSKDTDLSPGSKAEIDAGTDPYYQEVARVFQRAVYDTQPNYSEMQRPAILRSESDLTKMLTMYKTVPLQYYNMMYEAVGRLRADKARYKQNASAENKANYEQSKSFAAKTFVGVLSANVVYVVMKALIKGTIGGKKKKYLDDEGDLDAGKIFGGLGKDLIETYAGSIIGGSDLLTSVEKLFDAATTGSYSRYGGTEISALSAIEDTLGGLYNLAKEIHDQDLTGGLGAVKELAKQLAMDTGIPANNIETYLLGTMKWIAPEWVDRYENFFDEFERADLKGEHGRDLRAAIRVLMDNRTDGLKDETIDEIMRLWENGQNAAIPSAIPSKVSIDGEDVEIKGADRSAFRERWGQVIGESLEKLLASDAYETADDKGKAKLIAKLYEYARQQAAAAVTERLDAWVEFGKACEAAGIPLTDYLTVASVDKGKLKDMDGEALDSAIRSRMEFRVGELNEKTLDELGRLFANGASGAIPSDVPTSVSVSGEERKLTPEERVAWLQAWKRIAGEGLEGLISSGAYKTADDAGKAKMLSALYDMARESASSEVVNGYAPDKWVSVGMEAAERGVPIDEYASFHVGMSGLKTAEKLALLKGQSWSDNQKEFIWTELMATDTQYSKYQNLKNAGMKWADAMEQLGIGAASTTPSGLTDAQQAQYDKFWNEISGPATQQLLNNADYKKADKAGQAAFLDRLNDYAARVAKAKVLSGYDKGKWVECGERLTASGVKLDEYIVYCAETSDANNRAKYSALAKTGWTDAQKLTALEYISTPTYSAGKVGRDYEIPVQRYLEGLTKADADESGNINQAEAEAWLDRSGLDWESKAYLWQMLCYSSKWKNNPYSTTLGEDIWHSLHPDG